MEFLEVAVLGLLAIAAAQTFGGRLRRAAPLLLVLLGIGVSLLPFIEPIVIEPEWILAGVLPPLLYSASAAMPAMDFRRDFTAISGLSVVLVVVSSVLLGLFFSWVIPDLSLAWGIALGAIVSPTDAVATSIVKGLGVSPRSVAILEGESLLNDATALVILRAGIAGAAAAVSLWAVFGQFVYAVAVAAFLGFVVGRVNLRVRGRIRDPAVNTVVSFTVPFLASIPAELLGASGLVAAVVAGLVTGRGAARVLSPQHRLSDMQNWRAIEVVLEGGVFLVMGLQLYTIVGGVRDEHQGFALPILVAGGALLLTVLIRTGYVALLLWGTRKRTDRGAEAKPGMTDLKSRLDADEPFTFNAQEMVSSRRARDARGRRREPSARRLEQLNIRLRRGMADIDYFLAQPLGWREGVIVVWAGMRGAVTLAAAQTLPADPPNRSLLILIAFLVAVSSLLLQGGTISAVVGWVKPTGRNVAVDRDEHVQLMELLEATAIAATVEPSPTQPAPPLDGAAKKQGLGIIDAQREVLLDARDDGMFSSAALTAALDVLDADQISLELRGAPSGE
jgi:NhaP-type Na+/H+ or K+/H+ antiporter